MNIQSFADWLRSILESAKFWYMVNPWECAVRVRAGRYAKQIDPGTYLRTPFIDTITLVNTRLRITSTPSLTITTRDGKTVTLAVMVGFKIVDPLLAMRELMTPEYTCAAMAQAATAASAARRNADELREPAFLDAIKAELIDSKVPGVQFETIKITEMAVVRTFRLLQDSWKPMTSLAPDGSQF